MCMSDLFEKVGRPGKVLSTTPVYHGPIFDLVKQTIETPDGLEVKRDLIQHGNAVTILAMTADDQVVLGSEYRVGRNAETISLPAGLINTGRIRSRPRPVNYKRRRATLPTTHKS